MTGALKKTVIFFNKYRPVAEKFFGGKLYPFIIAALVLIGHISGAEFYLNIFTVLSTALALCICKSIKPFLPVLFTIVYQVNLKHAPGIPYWSDYYMTDGRPVIFIILVVILAAALIYYAIRHVFPKISFKNSPMLLATLILCGAFLLNGAFSSKWKPADLLYGVAEVLVFFFLFYLLYHGLEDERSDELLDHFSYITLLVAMILVGEVVYTYATNDMLFAEDGSIIKENILFGWGVNNSMGFSLAVLIPTLMRGAIKSKYSLVYFGASVLTLAAAFLTLSRNAWFCGSLAFGISLIVACFIGEKKRFYRILTIAGICLGIIILIIFRDKFISLFASLLDKGIGDNGRFELWRQGIKNFHDFPFFGTGFFGYGAETFETIDFLPTMAHNTPVQLLSSMGILGFAAYIYYRVKTLIPFFKKPTFEKGMLYLILCVTLGASMLDNFIFYFSTAFQYIFALVLAFKIREEQQDKEKTYKLF